MEDPFSTFLLSFWHYIQPFDFWLIQKINQDWGNSFFDTFLPYLREARTWIPLYVFLILFSIFNFGKKGWWWVLGAILVAGVADLVSSQIIKQIVMRDRPCQDPNVAPYLRFFVNYCPKSSSFTSSHATSFFAQASYFFFTLYPIIKRWGYVFFVWSASIAFTQVYVAVHYPFDVFCGALLGTFLGWSIYRLYNNKIGKLSLVSTY